MKLTADTITDEQIWGLLYDAAGWQNRETVRACVTALGMSPTGLKPSSIFHRGWERRVKDARARCAEILNARNEVKP